MKQTITFLIITSYLLLFFNLLMFQNYHVFKICQAFLLTYGSEYSRRRVGRKAFRPRPYNPPDLIFQNQEYLVELVT